MASDEDADLPYHAFAQVSRSIHIGNVPPHTTGAEIRDSFAQYGRIISVSPNIYSKVNKGFAFVNFQDVGSAIRAVNASQDRHLFGQPKGRVVVTFQNLLSPRSTTQKRKYPHTAKPGDEWFERKNAGRSAAASVNASSPPRGPKSMTREISPPPVKRARLLKQVPPLSHESRSSNPQMGPERTLEQPQRPQNSAARSTSCKTGIDYWFTRDDNCEDPSRENGYNDDASDSEIKALRKQARLLKRSSTKPPLSVSINPSGPANPKAQAIDLGSKMKTPGVSVPLEEASRSPLEAGEIFSPTHSCSASSARELRCADCGNLEEPDLPLAGCSFCPRRYHPLCGSPCPCSVDDGAPFVCSYCALHAKERTPLTPSSPGQSHAHPQASSPRQTRSVIDPKMDSPTWTSKTNNDHTIQTEALSSDYFDQSRPLSPLSRKRRAKAAEIARLYKEVTCARWMKDRSLCKYVRQPDRCTFAHYDTGLYINAPFRPESARAFTCPSWSRYGSCPEPERCGFAHSDTGRYLDKDGRPCTRHITCSFWNFGHRCKFRDDECLYAHYDSGQYVSNPSPADGKDPRLAGATHTPAQRTSINPNTSTAPGIQPLSGGAFDDGKPDMQPQTALSPFNGAKVPSANSRLPSASVRETSLPRSDYFADGSHPFVHGSTVAPNPGKGLHCVDTPNSPEPTICSTDGYVQHSASNSVVVEEGGPQGHTATAIPVGTSAADDDAALSTEPTQTPLNPRPESQAPVVTPADERPIEVPQVKHFARPSAVLLDPRKRRKQSKTTTVSLARDLDAEVARPSTVFSSVSLCKACGKKLFGSADHCNACREKSTLASQAAAKIPTPAQSPAAVDDNRSVKDDIGSVNPLADPAPRTESAHDGASIMPAIQSVGGLAPQTGQQDTPVVAGPKAAVTVTPAKRPASSISPLFSKRRLINPLEGPKKPFSTVREPSKPKPSLEDLTQQALRQRGEAEVTGVSRQTTAVKDVSSEKEPHGPTEQDTVDASLERATHDPHPLLQTPFSHALPKAPSGILAQTEPSNRSLEADQIVEEVPSPPRQTSAQSEYSDRSLETDPTVEEGSSPPKQASAQPSQFHPQNHGQHLLDDADDADDEDDEDDEDDLPLRVLKKARLERDGGISQGEIFQDGQGAIGPVTTLEPILEHGEDDPSQDLDDDHVAGASDGASASTSERDSDSIDEDEDEQHGSPEELVVCEDVARKSVLSDTANRPVSTEVANYAQHVQRSADAGFDEAAHLQRLRENGAMIEDESDEEASDIEMSDSATSPEPKAQEAAEHLGLLRACPVKTSRDLFEVAPRFRPVTQPAGPARYQPRGQTGQSKKKLWENLSTYQCRYQEQRFGDPHQTIEVPPERSLFAIVRESAPQMAHADVVERPSIFDVAPVVLKKRKMQFADFVGVLRDPVIIRDGAMRDLVFVDKSRLENETRGRRVAMEKFPFIKG